MRIEARLAGNAMTSCACHDAGSRSERSTHLVAGDIATVGGIGTRDGCRGSAEARRWTKLIIDFPNHIVFYIERECVIEAVRVLGAGQDLRVEIERQ